MDALLATTDLTALWVALSVAIPAVAASTLAPLLLQRQSFRRQDAVADKVAAVAEKTAEVASQAQEAAALLVDRQDASDRRSAKIASQAEVAAKLLLDRQDDSDRRTDEVARVAAASQAATDGKLDQIHTLVNSRMTEEMKRALVAIQGQLVLHKRVLVLLEVAGTAPTEEDVAVGKALEAQVVELGAALSDRLHQTVIADKQANL